MAQIFSTSLFSDSALKGYWRFENNLTDSSSSGYNLTDHSSSDIAGKYGRGRDFELSSNQYASIADASCPSLEISGSQTWMCWMKPESIVNYECVMGKGTGGGGSISHSLLFGDASQGLFFTLTGLTTTPQINYTFTFVVGTWYHIAGVYDSSASKIRLYLNGAKVAEQTASGSATDTNGDMGIGAMGDASSPFDGIVDDAAIFNKALTTAEILAVYTDTSPNFLPFL